MIFTFATQTHEKISLGSPSLHVTQALKLREMVTIRRSTENTGFRQRASITSSLA